MFLWLLLKLGVFVCLFVRAGELSAAELDSVMTVVANPRQFKIPDWFLNRKKDYKDGKYSQVVSNALDMGVENSFFFKTKWKFRRQTHRRVRTDRKRAGEVEGVGKHFY